MAAGIEGEGIDRRVFMMSRQGAGFVSRRIDLLAAVHGAKLPLRVTFLVSRHTFVVVVVVYLA